MTTDLNTLLTALYVKIDDHLAGRRRMGRRPPTVKRSELAGWAKYGYCRSHSHSRWFWGLRLRLVRTPAGLPVTWALDDPKIDERQVLMAICDHTADAPSRASESASPNDFLALTAAIWHNRATNHPSPAP